MKESTAAFSEELSLFQRNTGTVNVLKFRTPQKKEHPRFIFSAHQWLQMLQRGAKVVTSPADILVVFFLKLRFTDISFLI